MWLGAGGYLWLSVIYIPTERARSRYMACTYERNQRPYLSTACVAKDIQQLVFLLERTEQKQGRRRVEDGRLRHIT